VNRVSAGMQAYNIRASREASRDWLLNDFIRLSKDGSWLGCDGAMALSVYVSMIGSGARRATALGIEQPRVVNVKWRNSGFGSVNRALKFVCCRGAQAAVETERASRWRCRVSGFDLAQGSRL
jgi:hypothetical protein